MPAPGQRVEVPSADATVTPAPSDAPKDCFVERLPACYGSPRSINELRRVGVEAFVATYAGDGDAVWNTPDGHRPTREEIPSTSAILVRPLQFESAEALVADPDLKLVITRGGRSGCDSMTFAEEETLDLAIGSRYVVVVMPVLDSLDKPSPNLRVLAAWPVNKDGLVQTTADGSLAVDSVEDGLKDGIEEPDQPPEPSEGGPG